MIKTLLLTIILSIVAYGVDVVVDTATQVGTSNYSPGMSLIDNELDYPWTGNDQNSVSRATQLWTDLVVYSNTHIMAWGAPNPWPDSTTPDPTVWYELDSRMQLAASTNKTPVITLCEAPWWMKGALNGDGTTQTLTEADEWTDLGYGSRILDNMMDKWLHLVQRVAERYMVSPYNVRHFQVWNELKGYYNPILNQWDYDNSSGDSSGPNAKHGYTFLYNKTYKKLVEVAANLSITEQIIVGGPYPVMDTWGGSQSNPSKYSYSWGTFDQRPIDALQFWLANKEGGSFLAFDGGNMNRDDINPENAFVHAEKFRDMVSVVRDQTGGSSIPVWFSEWYCYPRDSDAYSDDLNAALKTYAVMLLLNQNVQTTLSWGGSDLGLSTYEYGTWNNTQSANGGYPTTWFYSYKVFKDHFAPGTPLSSVSISDNSTVHAVASDKTIMLVSKVNTSVTVTITSGSSTKQIELGAYKTAIADLPSASTSGTTSSSNGSTGAGNTPGMTGGDQTGSATIATASLTLLFGLLFAML